MRSRRWLPGRTLSEDTMITRETYATRRQRLTQTVNRPILLVGNGARPRNLPMSTLPFRQDSTFLYFTGCHLTGAALTIIDGQSTLYLPQPAEDDALWHGVSQSIEEMAANLGFEHARPIDRLESDVTSLEGVATLAVPDLAQTQLAARLTGKDLAFGRKNGDQDLVDAVISMRRVLSPVEHEQMRTAAKITRAAHLAAMAATRPGAHERELAAAFQFEVAKAGLTLAYPSIVTVRGEVLHNFEYVNVLEEGQLLLLDGGAEAATGYATDVTRTWPVSGVFSPRQRAAYDAVLQAQLESIDLVREGTRYRDVHTKSSEVLATFLADEGLLKCSPSVAVETGAHALFFPHGVGHLLGLDVHDLENFGDQAAYPPGRRRSTQFGTGYLRLDLDLEPGMVVTVEPGFYVVPAILDDPALVDQFSSLVDFEAARQWVGFGGIRIEDDVVVTPGNPDVLTADIPKDPDEICAAVGR